MCLLEAGGVRSLSLSVEGRENTEGVGEQGCEVRSDSTAEHLHTLSPCVSLLLTLKGVSLGIQSICPHEDALFLSPLCFTHYALYKVFIGLCQTSSAFLRGKKCQHMKRKTLHILLVVCVCVCLRWKWQRAALFGYCVFLSAALWWMCLLNLSFA